jgi:hypothetical protein
VLSGVFFLLFFTSFKTGGSLYYKIFGKDLSFYVYILHVGVGIVLGKFCTYESPMVKCLAVFAVSVVLYMILYRIVPPFVKLLKKGWRLLPEFS